MSTKNENTRSTMHSSPAPECFLAIDIGNSTTTVARCEGGQIHRQKTVVTSSLHDKGIEELLEGIAEGLTAAILASVVPSVTPLLFAALAAKGFHTLRLLESGKDSILPLDLETPQTTGVDRLLAARAARDGWGVPVVVVQVGTAVTVDAVDNEGVFRGGAILPGPRLWLEGLSHAALLPSLSPEAIPWDAPTLPGRSTREAIVGGLAVALPRAIDAAIERIGQSVGMSLPLCPQQASQNHSIVASTEREEVFPRVLLTGGWATILCPYLLTPVIPAPDLVIEGLRRVWMEERGVE